MIAHPHISIGRRKTSVARVILKQGNGVVTINKQPLEKYFPVQTLQTCVKLTSASALLTKKLYAL